MSLETGNPNTSRDDQSTREILARTLRILVTGGGTGGHVTPAVATIDALRKSGQSIDFLYVGSKHGVEGRIAGEIGVQFAGIETGKLRRAKSLIGLFSVANFKDLLNVPVGYLQALRIVDRFRPHIVLSTGGYVSVPGVMAAAALQIPIVAHEQTVQVGLANKINFRVAKIIALSFDETKSQLNVNLQSKAVVTGNPVRESIFCGDREHAIAEFGFDHADNHLPTVYVTGGAQGSQKINHAVGEALSELLKWCRVIHQSGAQQSNGRPDSDWLRETADQLCTEYRRRFAIRQYIGAEIGDVYALSDIIIGRSGAGTVSEVTALGKPAIFIPLVPTGGDEQTRNAQRLVNAGAAVLIPQDSLTSQALLSAARSLLSDPDRRKQMGEKSLSMGTRNAATDLAALIQKLGIEVDR